MGRRRCRLRLKRNDTRCRHILEEHTLSGESVQMRGYTRISAIAAEDIRAESVEYHEENLRSRIGSMARLRP